MSESTSDDEFIIETEGVRVNFGDFWALKGIDVKIRKGEIIVILVPSGSGKSTCIRTLNRLQPMPMEQSRSQELPLTKRLAWRTSSASGQRSDSSSSSSSCSPI